MSFLFCCIVFSAMLIYLAKIPVAVAMQAQGGYDNHHPRAQQASLTGFGARALAAHNNSFEAFGLFAAGALMAYVGQADIAWTNALAATFVIARILYILCYLADLHWQRSLVWSLGLICSLLLMVSPAIF